MFEKNDINQLEVLHNDFLYFRNFKKKIKRKISLRKLNLEIRMSFISHRKLSI